MNILVIGAGAIGSFFGALLSQKNTVLLLGRTSHIHAIQQRGLQITGKTNLTARPCATDTLQETHLEPDLVLVTVKSYDTETSIRQSLPLIGKNTVILSLQNGLDNIEKLEGVVKSSKILAGVTTQGALFSEPGVIVHTGMGNTILGELDGKRSERLRKIVNLFNQAGIETQASSTIQKEIWVKAIINSSINPLTAFFGCQNGYLLENPVMEKTTERICIESTHIAQAEGFNITTEDMIQRTKKVIRDTQTNFSSMLQSRLQGKKTEIDSINGKLVLLGNKHNIPTQLNKLLCVLIASVSEL